MRIAISGLLLFGLTASAADLDQLAFITGCWSMNRNGSTVEEMWNKPSGGSMMGVGRTVSAAGKMVQLKLGGPLTVFPASKISDTEVVFSNLEHDFPQRIIYRLQPDGNLFAR